MFVYRQASLDATRNMRVSINYLSELTGKERRTIRKKCDGLTSEKGPKQAILYDSSEALARIYGDTSNNAMKERARLDHHRANLEEMREAKMRGDLVDFDAIVEQVSKMIATARAKLLALPQRVAQSLAVAPEVRREIQAAIQKEVFSTLDELSTQHLESGGVVEPSVEGPATDDGERVGGSRKGAKSGGERGVREVAQ